MVHKTKKNKNTTQPREAGNIWYTRQRKTKQKQSRETGNIWYTRQRKTKTQHNMCWAPIT